MRSVVKEDDSVGMLLFDEPSASLDPTAEHGKLPSHPIPPYLLTECAAQTSLDAYASSEGTRRWSSRPIALESLRDMPTSYCKFRLDRLLPSTINLSSIHPGT